MAMRCSLGIPWAVGLASVYRKGALISVPASVVIRAAVGRTPISPPETILAGMCTKFIEEFTQPDWETLHEDLGLDADRRV
jgi:hypothetical protein